jgi:chromosome segregation ATPase
MHRALIVFAISLPALAQTPSPDAQLTQALLTEIRQLRQDLQTTAASIQRIQIVMYRLQAQTAVVNRATQRLDDARNRCTAAQNQQRGLTTQIQQMEERLRGNIEPVERKQVEEQLRRLKSNLELFAAEEQQCHAREADADSQVRVERVKMSELEDQLDKLDKVLAGAVR